MKKTLFDLSDLIYHVETPLSVSLTTNFYSVFLQGLQANIIQQFEENAIIHQQQQQQNQNQDSSDRSRSSSFNEAAYRK